MKTNRFSIDQQRILCGFWGRFVGILLLAAGLTAVVRAHAELESATPEPGATVNNPVEQIQLVFTESIRADSSLTLFKDDFQQVTPVSSNFNPAEPTILTAAVPELEPGNYTVQYSAFSLDGHEINGSYAFRLSTSNLPRTEQQLLIVSLAILLLIGIVVIWRQSQKWER